MVRFFDSDIFHKIIVFTDQDKARQWLHRYGD